MCTGKRTNENGYRLREFRCSYLRYNRGNTTVCVALIRASVLHRRGTIPKQLHCEISVEQAVHSQSSLCSNEHG